MFTIWKTFSMFSYRIGRVHFSATLHYQEFSFFLLFVSEGKKRKKRKRIEMWSNDAIM